MLRAWLLLFVLFLAGCPNLEKVPTASIERPEYSAPDWTKDECIAAVDSKVSPENQKLLRITMRNILEGETSNFKDYMRNLRVIISDREVFLQRAIAEYTPDSSVDEVNFITYCAEIKAQIELLKIHLYYQEDLLRIHLSMNRLTISLPEDN
jgi:hypothetical protein